MLLFGIAACSFFSASVLLMAKGKIRWKVGGRWKKSPAPKKACWALNRGFWQHLTPSFYFEFVRSDWKGNLICNKNYYILWIILSVFYENQAWLQNITLDPICVCDSYFSSFNTYNVHRYFQFASYYLIYRVQFKNSSNFQFPTNN